MRYVKDNVERYVGNIVDAKKLESDGFTLVDEPFQKRKRVESINPPVPEVKEQVTPTPQRGRRKKEL